MACESENKTYDITELIDEHISFYNDHKNEFWQRIYLFQRGDRSIPVVGTDEMYNSICNLNDLVRVTFPNEDENMIKWTIFITRFIDDQNNFMQTMNEPQPITILVGVCEAA
jgi:hypothetical protein